MTKSELVERLAADLGITVTDSDRFLNGFINLIYRKLAEGGVVNISGFGQFRVSKREARIGVNPRNPTERITIPKLHTAKFKAGSAFKQAVKLRE